MDLQSGRIEHHTGTFDTGDGLRLFAQYWQPVKETAGVVVLVHGVGEHSGRYGHVARHFGRHNLALCAFDLRGHGRSEGRRAFVNRFEDYLADLERFWQRVRRQYPESPLFLLGHSMGGAVAAWYCLDHRPAHRGLILSSAALKVSDDFSPMLQKLSGIIGKLAPKLPTLKIDSKWISRDPQVVKAYDADPLVYHGGILARTGAEIIRAARQIQTRLDEFTMPLLILHGTEDHLTDPQGSKQLYLQSPSRDKTLKLYEGCYHDTMNEPEKEQVLNDVVAWMEQRS